MNISRTLFVVLIFSVSLSAVSQDKVESSGLQFLFPDFSTGKILQKNGGTQVIMMNYNTVSEKMVFKKGAEIFDMAGTEQLDTVYLQTRRFIPVGKVFHEVLLASEISLFMQHRSSLLEPGAPAGYGSTTQTASTKIISSLSTSRGFYNLQLPSDYVVNPDNVYWIRKGTTYDSFTNEKQFLKLFPDKEDELKQFIKKNKIKFEKVPGVIMVVEYCNEITGQK